MFTDQERFKQQAMVIARNLTHDFYEKKKSMEDILSAADPHGFSWIGAGKEEVFCTLNKARIYFAEQRREKAVPPIEIHNEVYEVQLLAHDICLVICEYLLNVTPETGQVLSEWQRKTIIVRQDEEGKCFISHIHASNPWSLMHDEESFPTKIGRRDFEYMTELLQQKKFQEIRELTKRQNQILFHMVQGKTYPQIALALGITERTVRYHVNEICARYKVSGRKQLMAYLFEQVLEAKEEVKFS
ncbi:helix-turn-helix transcriptional regulator [Mitsuokella sp. AF21-1AC]|uniref:helix-turn-helix transcriptional regulator n=1 Tax=Mitsuokella sp. AF21-1AC TaxID=2292235 RepID=UPI0013141A9E|nr:helix-turn-helix transcriptional regulator [Mitsuokella sp. AF21-1AC]